ncbi:MAG: hypothetical protein AAB900_00455 [Patescibacteria group bacterium]
MNNKKFKNQKLTAGFTLIETFAAIIILLIAILGPLTLLSRAITDGLYAQNQITSSFLLQEGLDLAINHWEQLTKDNFDINGSDINNCTKLAPCYVTVADSGDVSFKTFDNGSICFAPNPDFTDQNIYQQTGSACDPGLATIFTRQIWFHDIIAKSDEADIFGQQIGKIAYVQTTWTHKGAPPRVVNSSTILLK